MSANAGDSLLVGYTPVAALLLLPSPREERAKLALRVGGGGSLHRNRCSSVCRTPPHPRPLPAMRKGAWREGRSPCMTSRSRGVFSREVCSLVRLPLKRGRRECRAPDAPASRVCNVVVERTRVRQVTPVSPGIPRAMVYGLYRALPGDRALLPPSPVELPPRT